MKYTIKHLRIEFATDAKCLQYVFDNRYGKKFKCPQCQQKGKFYLIEGRKRFDCVCGFSVSPLASTIFHKSSTPLTLWFHAIFLFASSRNGVAAKELERQLGVTYKCAWRIRKSLQSFADMPIKKMLMAIIKIEPKLSEQSPEKVTWRQLYNRWHGMITRCYDKASISYKHYGARGITVCQKWLNFDGFKEDMGGSYKNGLSLERVNNDGNYELANCTWIPLKDQAKNRRK